MHTKNFLTLSVTAFTLIYSGFANSFDEPSKPGSCLDTAADYNAFIKEDFSAFSTDAQGRIAVGGDFNVQNYGLASSIVLSPEKYALIAGGNVSFQNGQVYTGSVVTRDDTPDFNSFTLLDPAASVSSNAASPIDFDAEFIELVKFSEALTELPETGTLDYHSWGGMYLHGDCNSDIQVFSVDGEQLQNSVVFALDCVPAEATVIFNINGTDVGLKNMGLQSLASHASKILFNFYEANNLELANIGIEGSILAPKADANVSWGYVNGTVITKSWNGPMELHHVPFTGCLAIPQNQAVIIGNTNPPTSVKVGEEYFYDVEATDPDGDFINHIILSFPNANGLSISEEGIVSWIPQASDVGDYEIFIIAQDDFGGRDILEYRIFVTEE